MKIKSIVFFTFLIFSVSISSAQEPFIGEIRIFAGNFAPRGWAFCDGQLLSISQNSALFSILGTTYGGDGRTTFALPDLRGRTAVHSDNNKNWSNLEESEDYGIAKISLGQKGGSESFELRKVDVFEDETGKSGKTYTIKNSSSELYKRDPFLGVHYIIALQGIYPSRN